MQIEYRYVFICGFTIVKVRQSFGKQLFSFSVKSAMMFFAVFSLSGIHQLSSDCMNRLEGTYSPRCVTLRHVTLRSDCTVSNWIKYISLMPMAHQGVMQPAYPRMQAAYDSKVRGYAARECARISIAFVISSWICICRRLIESHVCNSSMTYHTDKCNKKTGHFIINICNVPKIQDGLCSTQLLLACKFQMSI